MIELTARTILFWRSVGMRGLPEGDIETIVDGALTDTMLDVEAERVGTGGELEVELMDQERLGGGGELEEVIDHERLGGGGEVGIAKDSFVDSEGRS